MYEEELISYLESYNQLKHGYFNYLPLDKEVRALMNITMPYGLSDEFYKKQDAFLEERLKNKNIADASAFTYKSNMSLYQGDITLIKADAIMNACNEKLLGCFVPLHGCIDNAIHSAAGLEVRRDLLKIMTKQGHDEPNGRVKVTKGYNLPAKYIFHTVGPVVMYGEVTEENEDDLRKCYLSCLKKADEMKLHTLVFCSISTGIYGYPIEKAAKVAVNTTRKYLENNNSDLKIVFNVFSDRDRGVYENELNEN